MVYFFANCFFCYILSCRKREVNSIKIFQNRKKTISPYQIITTCCDISNPGKSLISGFFDDLQVTDLNTRNCEIRNFKFDRNWRFGGLIFILNWWQSKVGSHQKLSATLELLDVPNDSIFGGVIRDGSNAGFEFGGVSVTRDWDENVNIVCGWFWFKLRFSLYVINYYYLLLLLL